MRITGQLIDAASNAHVWADKFDGPLDDIFELQDQVTASVVGAMAPQLEQAEIQRATRKPTGSLQSYDYYLRGLAAFHRDELQAHREALQLFYKAIELDPDFAAAHGMAAWCYSQRLRNGWIEDFAQEQSEARRLAVRAAALGQDDAMVLCTAGRTLGQIVHELDAGLALIDRALELNPNLAIAWSASAWLRAWGGEPELAIEHAARASRLSPLDPLGHYVDAAAALAHFIAGRYDEAAVWAEKSASKRTGFLSARRILAASLALAGRIDQAKAVIAQAQALSPAMRIADVRGMVPWRHEEHMLRYIEGLRRAGMPE